MASDNRRAVPLTVAAYFAIKNLEDCHVDLCILDRGIEAAGKRKIRQSLEADRVNIHWIEPESTRLGREIAGGSLGLSSAGAAARRVGASLSWTMEERHDQGCDPDARGKPSLIYIFEATPGKNAALNGGLALVSGDLTVMSDDDAVLARKGDYRRFPVPSYYGLVAA